jgi:hypothetical protein
LPDLGRASLLGFGADPSGEVSTRTIGTPARRTRQLAFLAD